MNIELQTRLLRLKSVLNRIKDTSYAYSLLNQNKPFHTVKTNQDILEMIDAYETIIKDLYNYLKNTYEHQ